MEGDRIAILARKFHCNFNEDYFVKRKNEHISPKNKLFLKDRHCLLDSDLKYEVFDLKMKSSEKNGH